MALGRMMNPGSWIAAADFDSLPAASQCEVRRFLDQADGGNPYQDPAFCRRDGFGGGDLGEVYAAEERAGHVVFFARGIENFALSRYLPQFRALIVQKGPVVADLEALSSGLRHLQAVCRDRRFAAIHISPLLDAANVEEIDFVCARLGFVRARDYAPAATLRLDVTDDLDLILARFTKHHRYELRRAERLGIGVRQGCGEAEFREFYAIYQRRAQRKRWQPLSAARFAHLAERITVAPDRGAVILAEHDGCVIGGAVMMRAGPRVHYVYGAVESERAGTLPAAYPLIWRAIQWAKELGCRQLDFGGYGSSGQEKVQRFKQGFGGGLQGFAGAYVCELSPGIADMRRRVDRLKSALSGRGSTGSPHLFGPRC